MTHSKHLIHYINSPFHELFHPQEDISLLTIKYLHVTNNVL